MIITFSTTAKLAAKANKPDPLLTGIKTVTRRKWCARTAKSWIKHWKKPHKAYDTAPYCQGKQIGIIELKCPPYQEKLADMPVTDLYHEGDFWNSLEEYYAAIDCTKDDLVWVVRFKFK